MDNKTLYDEIQEDLEPLMRSNIEDDMDFDKDPWDVIPEYCGLILDEIDYERRQNYEVYSKEEMDKLQATVNRVLEKYNRRR